MKKVGFEFAGAGQVAGVDARQTKDHPRGMMQIHFPGTLGSDGQWTDVVVGQGNLNLPEFVSALETARFDGIAVLEYEGDVEDPVPALRRCVESMRHQTDALSTH